jgi:hypothetical protein
MALDLPDQSSHCTSGPDQQNQGQSHAETLHLPPALLNKRLPPSCCGRHWWDRALRFETGEACVRLEQLSGRSHRFRRCRRGGALTTRLPPGPGKSPSYQGCARDENPEQPPQGEDGHRPAHQDRRCSRRRPSIHHPHQHARRTRPVPPGAMQHTRGSADHSSQASGDAPLLRHLRRMRTIAPARHALSRTNGGVYGGVKSRKI